MVADSAESWRRNATGAGESVFGAKPAGAATAAVSEERGKRNSDGLDRLGRREATTSVPETARRHNSPLAHPASPSLPVFLGPTGCTIGRNDA